jgi:hypothetical protein
VRHYQTCGAIRCAIAPYGPDANFPGFGGSDARGFSSTRYNFQNGWFVGNAYKQLPALRVALAAHYGKETNNRALIQTAKAA